jgi:peptide/nickel transport system substrate-binding protein
MRSIGLRWLAGSRQLAALLSLFAFASAAFASAKPRYGGVLRVELLASSATLDPRAWKPGSRDFATNERLAALVLDRLVALDNYGRFVPQLATEWSHDASSRRWQFAIRADVRFSDGTTLTAADVAAALAPLLPEDLKISASGGSVVFQSAESRPDLLQLLASGRFFVFRVLPDAALAGTGAFKLEEVTKNSKPGADASPPVSQAAPQRLRFVANENCWAGRPFLDAIDVTLGVPPLRALFDLQVGKAELVELAPDTVRRASQSNTRVWTSAPLTLYGLRFADAQLQGASEKLREAVSLSLDRGTMAGVLLQKQAEPAAALLPQWLSGYAFLFRAETSVERAKELRVSLPANVAGGSSPLRSQTDVSGDLPRLLAERVAVNVRQAGISVQMFSKSAERDSSTRSADLPEMHLFAWRIASLSPGEELRSLAKAQHVEETKEGNPSDPNRRYAWERKIVEERKLMPLVILPDYAALAPTVRDWQPSPWGEWRLADVWLDTAAGQKAGAPSNSVPSGATP